MRGGEGVSEEGRRRVYLCKIAPPPVDASNRLHKAQWHRRKIGRMHCTEVVPVREGVGKEGIMGRGVERHGLCEDSPNHPARRNHLHVVLAPCL